jgi:hypothetical protein
VGLVSDDAKEELFDKKDLRLVGRVVVYTIAVLWASLIFGLAVRLFMWVAFAGSSWV